MAYRHPQSPSEGRQAWPSGLYSSLAFQHARFDPSLASLFVRFSHGAPVSPMSFSVSSSPKSKSPSSCHPHLPATHLSHLPLTYLSHLSLLKIQTRATRPAPPASSACHPPAGPPRLPRATRPPTCDSNLPPWHRALASRLSPVDSRLQRPLAADYCTTAHFSSTHWHPSNSLHLLEPRPGPDADLLDVQEYRITVNPPLCPSL